MENLNKLKSDIRRALKAGNVYSKSIEIQILSLATALRTLILASNEIETMDKVTVLEKTRYGEKLAPHPAFKVQKDAQDSVTRQMKALGLTAGMLTNPESDSLKEFLKNINSDDDD